MMQHYAISQIASFLGISTQTIRNYEKRGLIQIEKSKTATGVFRLRTLPLCSSSALIETLVSHLMTLSGL